jgi:hypothetical protein
MAENNSDNDSPEVVVLGDVSWQIILSPGNGGKDHFSRDATWGGAPLLHTIIKTAIRVDQEPKGVSECWPMSKTVEKQYANIKKGPIKGSLIGELGEFIAKLDFYPKSSGNDNKAQVLRLTNDVQAEATEFDINENEHAFQRTVNTWIAEIQSEYKLCNESNRKRLVIIYDRYFALSRAKAPLKTFLASLKTDDALVLAIEDNDQDEISKIEIDPDVKELVQANTELFKNRTTVVITADWLRKFGLPIAEYGSIEQAVRNVV